MSAEAGTTKRRRYSRRSGRPVPNPRISPPNAEVELWGEQLVVRLRFDSKAEAEDFFCAALRSPSVTAANLFIKGKFAGARDGMGS